MRIILWGEPKSTNSIYKTVCRGGKSFVYLTKEGKDIKEYYGLLAKSQFKGKPLKTPIKVSIDLYFGDKRRRDWDNYHKLSFDALNGIVWEDDSQIYEVCVRKFLNDKNPRIVLDIDTCN